MSIEDLTPIVLSELGFHSFHVVDTQFGLGGKTSCQVDAGLGVAGAGVARGVGGNA